MSDLYVLFDTETTGISQEDRIIQIGGMIIEGKNTVCYDELCSCDVSIKLEAMEVHGITQNMIDDKVNVKQTNFYQEILKHNANDNYLIAHNIKFDLAMLQKEDFENNYKLIDTLKCARHIYPDMPYHRLQYLRYALKLNEQENEEAKKLDITIKAHDAIGDVLIMKLLLRDLIISIKKKYGNINFMEKLVELTSTPVVIQTFRFGKYKGQSILDVSKSDAGYLSWMLNNMKDLDDDMRHTLGLYV